ALTKNLVELRGTLGHRHSDAAPASSRLAQNGITHLFRFDGSGARVREHALASRDDGDSHSLDDLARLALVLHPLHRLHRRADEDDSFRLARFGEGGVL